MCGRRLLTVGLAIGLALAGAPRAEAQRIVARGFVGSVDLATGSVRLRTYGRPRSVQLAFDGVVRWNGREIELAQLPLNAEVEVSATPGPSGFLYADEIRVVHTLAGAPPAALPPGALVIGEVVGVNLGQAALYVRTRSGYRMVQAGAAPILLNGEPTTLADVAPGDTVVVQRLVPSPGLLPVVQLVALFPGLSVEQVAREYRPLPTTVFPFPLESPATPAAARLP